MCTPVVATAKPMCTFDKVLNQRVDWVAWASIENGARDAIDDERASLPSPRPHIACACLSTKEKWTRLTSTCIVLPLPPPLPRTSTSIDHALCVARCAVDSCLTHTGRCIFVIYRYTPAHVRRTIHEAWFGRLGLHINGQFSCSNKLKYVIDKNNLAEGYN